MTEKLSAADFFDLLISKAPELRKAGVAHFVCGDAQVTLHPHVAEYKEPVKPKGKESDEHSDPLDDPALYGLSEGSDVPWSGDE